MIPHLAASLSAGLLALSSVSALAAMVLGGYRSQVWSVGFGLAALVAFPSAVALLVWSRA